ncbi:hypothetical protein [Vreelandella sulfidaeris]|uniref:hypothetical protein n=1 Tax=Vreelandella sulfidaeris TaxID=115553 RepID=UPI0035E74B46
MAMPPMTRLPPITGGHAGPSSAADTGHTGDVGGMTVGDYYGSGSRVRKQEGWNWQELAILGAVALVGVAVWKKL